MSEHIAVGADVEVTDRGTDTVQHAVVVERSQDQFPPNDHEIFIWVRYDNGCVVPIREYHVRALPTPGESVQHWRCGQAHDRAKDCPPDLTGRN